MFNLFSSKCAIALAFIVFLNTSFAQAQQWVRSEIYTANGYPVAVDVYQQQFSTNAVAAFRDTSNNQYFYASVMDFLGYLRSNYQDCTRIGFTNSLALVRDIYDASGPYGALVQCSWGLNSKWVLRLGIGAQAPLYVLTKLL